ncbi:hypothetical protein ACFL4G_09625 [Thermodesulfobacteriota bacterium]
MGDGNRGRQKERMFVEMVDLFLRSVCLVREQVEKYEKGTLKFSDIELLADDKGRSLLFQLKEKCHSIFRADPEEPSFTMYGLFDLTIGSIFHHAMKLREDLYQIEYYKPKYQAFADKPMLPLHIQHLAKEFNKIIRRAELDFIEGVEEIVVLFSDTTAQLKELLVEFSDYPILTRYILEEEDLIKVAFGESGVEDLCEAMFAGGLREAYITAGKSYFDSAHFDFAMTYFGEAVDLDGKDTTLRFLYNLSLGMDAYYRNDYTRAQEHFGKALKIFRPFEDSRKYLERIRDIFRVILQESTGHDKEQEGRIKKSIKRIETILNA